MHSCPASCKICAATNILEDIGYDVVNDIDYEDEGITYVQVCFFASEHQLFDGHLYSIFISFAEATFVFRHAN